MKMLIRQNNEIVEKDVPFKDVYKNVARTYLVKIGGVFHPAVSLDDLPSGKTKEDAIEYLKSIQLKDKED